MRAVCELCGKERALFVCSACGRKVCASCFRPSVWLCRSCYEAQKAEAGPVGAALPPLPIRWLVLSAVLAGLGLALLAMGSALSGGGAIVLVPFPIVVVGGLTALVVLLVLLAFLVASSLALLTALRWDLAPA